MSIIEIFSHVNSHINPEFRVFIATIIVIIYKNFILKKRVWAKQTLFYAVETTAINTTKNCITLAANTNI